MNARILELIKQPQQMLPEDLEVITKALSSQPYLQSLRALKLMGVHQYQPELYPTILSETAAYTTDKKILYQLIFGTSKSGNQIKAQESLEETIEVEKETIDIEEKPSDRLLNETKDTVEDSNLPIFEATEVKETPQDSMGIVLEEEELNVSNFDEVVESYHEDLNELSTSEIESNPIESPLEKETKPIEEEQPEIEASYEDTIVVEDATDTEIEEKEEVSEGLSFQQMEAFLPQVKFKIPKDEASATQQEVQPMVTEPQSDLSLEPEVEVVQEESVVNEEVAWQPMQLETRTPDALIGKPTPVVEPKVIVKKEEPPKTTDAPKLLVEEPIAEVKSTTIEPKVDILPETKVSKEEVSEVEPSGNDGESNVQTFINTWQNWLKVDRAEPIEKESQTTPVEEEVQEDNKSQIIEKFIETSPSISKVEKHSPIIKEEKEFSVKDKGDDISHLMTETLANLYVEQHLFAKGIEAYEILKGKYPEKASYFEEKIEEVKALKAGKSY